MKYIGTPEQLRNNKRMLQEIKSFEGKEIIISISKNTNKRTIEQNRLYFGYYLSYILKEEPSGQYNTIDEWHEYFKYTFLRKKHFKPVKGYFYKIGSTTDLNTKEFSEYIEGMCRHMTIEFNFYIPDPEDKNFEKWILECESKGFGSIF